MIIYLVLAILLGVFGILESIVFPHLPDAFFTVFNDGMRYISNGVSIVSNFVDLPYCRTLFAWWITLTSLLLSVELVYSIWSLITGHGHSHAAVTDGDVVDTSVYYNDDGTVRSTRERRSHYTRRRR